MSGNQEKLAVLFADISGSNDLYERLGNEQAHHSVMQCVGIMTRELSAFKGNLVKSIDDEIMCTFPTVEQAFHASCAMKGAVASCKHQEVTPMHVRIGFHFGEVILESGDVLGDTVNVAAQVAAITRASQIIVTQAVVDILPAALRDRTHQIKRDELKNKPGQFSIFQVICSSDEDPNSRVGSPAERKS